MFGKREDILLKMFAEDRGFIAKVYGSPVLPGALQDVPGNPYNFVCNEPAVNIWYVGHTVRLSMPPEARKGNWMAADLIDGRYTNHRSHEGLQAAIDSEFARIIAQRL
jgi:hypothetical protein